MSLELAKSAVLPPDHCMKSAPICLSAIFMVSASAAESMSSASLWPQIQTEVDAAACDNPQQHQAIAAGAKTCGGRQSYQAKPRHLKKTPTRKYPSEGWFSAPYMVEC